jgi:formylglycine-generating enzyme required for sulfatase activity
MEREWNIWKFVQGAPLPPRIVSPYDQSEMVLIPAGEFIFGIDEEELMQIFALDGKTNPVFMTEVPARKVFLYDYYIDVYPVTNAQYSRFIEETSHRKPLLWEEAGWNHPLQPVVGLGWDDARSYAAWVGKKLPSEEEWEKAARGTDRRWWPWGNDFYVGYVNSSELQIGRTTNVARFPKGASPYGCYDMSGNVWEMCEGFWMPNMPVMRGGCFLGRATFVRTTVRWSPEDPVNGAHWLGFRCAKEIFREDVKSNERRKS